VAVNRRGREFGWWRWGGGVTFVTALRRISAVVIASLLRWDWQATVVAVGTGLGARHNILSGRRDAGRGSRITAVAFDKTGR